MTSTMRDVAREAGVSIKTVSNVLNEYPYVRPSTRERVLAAIADLDYRPNPSARTLRSGRSGVLCLAVPELSLAYFAELADAVITAAEARGLVVMVEQTGGDRGRELALLSSPRLRMVDGLLLSVLGMQAGDLDTSALDVPLVLLGEQLFDPRVDHVTMQNTAAARALTEHLLARGRRRIAVLGTHPEESGGTAALRVRGYAEALAAAGVPLDEDLLVPAGLWHRRQGAEAMAALLRRGTPFDAVFGLNDTLALGAVHTLQATGRRVPEDVAVVGFDDIEEAQYAVPALTTVDAGRRTIAERAVDALVARIADRDAPASLQEVGYRIVERESTALAVAAPRRERRATV